MTTQTNLIDNIIDNATDLPIECQDWLLAIAKGMAYTKSCLLKQGSIDETNQSQKAQTVTA